MKTTMETSIAAKKEECAKWHADMKSQVAVLLDEARKIEDQIYIENQPKPGPTR